MRTLLFVLVLALNLRGQGVPGIGGLGALGAHGGGSSCGNSWLHCRSLTIDHTKVPNTDQTNFPVLLSATVADWAVTGSGGDVQNTVTQSGGRSFTIPADWIITTDSACATKIAGWEFEDYVTTTGAVKVWFNAAIASHTSDTVVWVCDDKAAVTTQQATVSSTWDTTFGAVWHFPNTSGAIVLTDSTTGANNGTGSGSPTGTTGQIAGAISLNGSSQSASFSDSSRLSPGAGNSTISAWVNTSGTVSVDQWIYDDYGVAASNTPLVMMRLTGSHLQAFYRDAAGNAATPSQTSTISANTWYYFAGTRNGTTVKAYFNGAEEGSVTTGGLGTITVSDGVVPSVGVSTLGANFWTGTIDEMRVANVARSADWLAAEYNNQNSPSTFVTVGSRL